MSVTSSVTFTLSRKHPKLRKLEIKKLQAYKVIEKIENLTLNQLFSFVPTQYLCLINVCFGGVAGVTSEQLNCIFNQLDGFNRIELIPGKPYSFALFDSVSTAKIAYDTLYEQPCENLNGKIIYLEFVNSSWIKFTPQDITVPGLLILKEFIPIELERDIIQELHSRNAWTIIQERKVQHFGYLFEYPNKVGDACSLSRRAFPEYMDLLLTKLHELHPFIPQMDQMTLQLYPIGAGIPPHVDNHTSFGEFILSFSLQSPVIMELKNLETGKAFHLDLPPRSLLIFGGEARYAWTHGIRSRRTDSLDNGEVRKRGERISLTLRTVSPTGVCKCKWPEFCNL
ncbi:hypothetical protein G9A89_013495 [Geosiphon pyriformis]|nr:hypothetical protein G9A89_013495 [Geosiphon pyriformis]